MFKTISTPQAIVIGSLIIAVAILSLRGSIFTLYRIEGLDTFVRLNVITGSASECSVRDRADGYKWECSHLKNETYN